jgi:hypothetical protein
VFSPHLTQELYLAEVFFCGASASGNLTLTGYAGTIVNWEYSIDGGATWIPIVNNTNTESLVGVSQTRIYRVVVQSGSCPTAISNTVTVTVYPQTVAGSVSGPINVCSGTNSGNLTLAGYTGTILGWVYSTNSGVSWTPVANTTNSIPYTNITQETWYKAIVRSGSCNTDSSSTGIIYVDPVSNGGVLSGGGTFLRGFCIRYINFNRICWCNCKLGILNKWWEYHGHR